MNVPFATDLATCVMTHMRTVPRDERIGAASMCWLRGYLWAFHTAMTLPYSVERGSDRDEWFRVADMCRTAQYAVADAEVALRYPEPEPDTVTFVIGG